MSATGPGRAVTSRACREHARRRPASRTPAATASSVDLPQPDGPTSATTSPGATDRSIPASTWPVPGYACSMPASASAASVSTVTA